MAKRLMLAAISATLVHVLVLQSHFQLCNSIKPPMTMGSASVATSRSTTTASRNMGKDIHRVLVKHGLPAGLLPKEVDAFSLGESGALEVFLERPCLAKFDNRVFYDAVVKANLSFGALTNVTGLAQEELFLWLPVKDIIVDDPASGVILFDIGVAHKELALSLFDFPPDCAHYPNPADASPAPPLERIFEIGRSHMDVTTMLE